MSLNPIEWIKEGFNFFLYNFVYMLLYYLEIAICKLLNWLQELMNVFTGTSMVTYKTNFGSSQNYLINIFFSNGAISGVYWGMAAIGVVMAFTFAIISVIRKMFDSSEKVKMSLGQILTNLFKSIFLIISLNVGMTVIITATNVLMQQVVYVFDHAEDIANGHDHIEYTDEQFAAMSRIFNTIGNYSLNPSYKNRYNINSCYNEIRSDLAYLQEEHVFDFYYETVDEDNNIVVTWQSLLQELANAADFNVELPVDVYNEGVSNAMYHIIDEMRNNPSIKVLKSYDRVEAYDANSVDIGRTLFVIGTMGNGITAAAKNNTYNQHPSLTDPVRAPYYRGTKSVYNIKDVNKDFDIAFDKTNYIIVYIAGAAVGMNMALIIVNCVGRIFNLMFLYLVAPPIFGIIPLDDGGKVKQWMTAFIVQAFSVFATVISMRVYLLFLPIILDPGLVISESTIVDMFGRVILLFAGIEAVSKANGLLVGILADSAGWQAINASDMSGYLKGSLGGRLAEKATGMVNSVPGRIVGGRKFANWLQGKPNEKGALTGGVAGTAMNFGRALAGSGWSGVKGAFRTGKKALFGGGGASGGAGGDAGGGSGGGAGGGAGGASNMQSQRNVGGAGGAGQNNKGLKDSGKQAAVPPPQRNTGGK